MSRFVRPSSYRHVYGQRSKVNYENAKISGSAWDTDLVTASGKYVAVNWQVSGGGAFAVLPSFSPFSSPEPAGFPSKLPDMLPLARGHTAPVLDTAWSPFDDNIVVSAGEDGKIFLWKVDDSVFSGWGDDGWEPTDLSPVGKLNAGGRKVGQVVFHPAAANVLASASGDHLVRIWDIEAGQEAPKLQLKGHGDSIQSIAWNSVGTQIATTCRDRKLRLFDPRAGSDAVHTVAGHSGIKGSRVVWLGDRDRIATTGFSKMSDRQLALWDTNALTNIETNSLDSSSGIIIPFFADGNNVLFLSGKGDGNIRYYEYTDDTFHFLNEYKSSDPQRGMGYIPRRALDISQNEIARAYKLCSGTIETLSFVVPRKAEGFQADLFPPAHSTEPALTADEWFDGKTAHPKMVDLETGSVSVINTPFPAVTPVKSSTPAAVTPAKQPSPKATPREASPVRPAREATPPPPKSVTPQAASPKAAAPQAATPQAATPPKHESELHAKSLEIEQPDSEDEDDSALVAAATTAAVSAPFGAAAVASKVAAPAASAATPANGGSDSLPVVPTDQLLVKLLSDKATLPTRGSPYSAGYDLYAAEATSVPARGKAMVDLQLSLAVPADTYGRIAPRSGLAAKHAIDVGAGVIDADYRGPVKVILFNLGDVDFPVARGDRVAQLILEKIHMASISQVDDLDATARGAGGFGSTGGFGAK